MTHRDDDRGRGSDVDWGEPGNGVRGRFSRQDQFGGRRGFAWSDEGQGPYGYGDEGFRGQERFAEPIGDRYGQGGFGQHYGGGDAYGREDFESARGWQPHAEQGWGNQGRTRAGSWDQNQNWERGPSGRGHWGQGYGDRSFEGQGRPQQSVAGSGYGGQSRPGGGTFSYEEVWLIPGPHSGRGPRGYQRNDQRIEEDICERLTQHGQIDASDIRVKVHNGEITLTGSVESRRTKRMAEDTLDSIPGIKDVHNQLRVQQSQDSANQQDQLVSQGQSSRGSGQSQGRAQARNQAQRQTAATGTSTA